MIFVLSLYDFVVISYFFFIKKCQAAVFISNLAHFFFFLFKNCHFKFYHQIFLNIFICTTTQDFIYVVCCVVVVVSCVVQQKKIGLFHMRNEAAIYLFFSHEFFINKLRFNEPTLIYYCLEHKILALLT